MSGLNIPLVGTCSVNLAQKMPWNDEGYRPPQVMIDDYHFMSCQVDSFVEPPCSSFLGNIAAVTVTKKCRGAPTKRVGFLGIFLSY